MMSDYLIVLQALTGGNMLTLDSQAVEITERPGPELEVIKRIPDVTNLLVWLNGKCDDDDDEEKKDKKEKEKGKEESGHESIVEESEEEREDKECIRLDLLEDILRQASVSYNIVHDKKDFQKELRSPYYTDLIILGSHHPIEDHFAEELREQVYSGKGLISSLWSKYEEHHGEGANEESSEEEEKNDPLFGIRFKGHLSEDRYAVELPESPVSGAGLLDITGKAVKIEADDDTVTAGWIKESEHPEEISNRTNRAEGLELRSQGEEEEENGESEEDDKEHPAIVLNEYGNGRTIYYAFDLGQTLNDLNYTQISEMIERSVSYVHNSASADVIYPNQMVPVEIKIENLGDAFDVRVTETYPQELKLYDPITGLWIVNNPWIIDMHLELQETKTILYYTLIPDTAGTYTLNTEVGYLDEAGVYNFHEEINLDISIDKDADEMAGDIISALNTISVSDKDENKIKKALKYIEKVRDRAVVSKENVEKNIDDLRKAVDSLLHIKSVNISETRLMMDVLLKIWESKYYFEIY